MNFNTIAVTVLLHLVYYLTSTGGGYVLYLRYSALSGFSRHSYPLAIFCEYWDSLHELTTPHHWYVNHVRSCHSRKRHIPVSKDDVYNIQSNSLLCTVSIFDNKHKISVISHKPNNSYLDNFFQIFINSKDFSLRIVSYMVV